MQDALAILEVVGIRAIFVEQLGRPAALYLRDGVLLIDTAASRERLGQIADEALAAAAAAIHPT